MMLIAPTQGCSGQGCYCVPYQRHCHRLTVCGHWLQLLLQHQARQCVVLG